MTYLDATNGSKIGAEENLNRDYAAWSGLVRSATVMRGGVWSGTVRPGRA